MNSNNIAIKVEGISKRYRIGLKEQVHDRMGGAKIDFIKNPLKNYRKHHFPYNFSDTKKVFLIFAEGTMFAAAMITLNPNSFQFCEADVVVFNVVESFGGDSARGDWHKHMSGVVRPMLNWSTEFYPQDM